MFVQSVYMCVVPIRKRSYAWHINQKHANNTLKCTYLASKDTAYHNETSAKLLAFFLKPICFVETVFHTATSAKNQIRSQGVAEL